MNLASKYVDVDFFGKVKHFGQRFLRFLLSDSRLLAQKANKSSLWANKFTVNVNFVGLFRSIQQFSQHSFNGRLLPAKVA